MHPLKAYRSTVGLTQKQAAEKFGTGLSYVSQIERGERYPSRRLAKRIEKRSGGVLRASDLLIFEACRRKGKAA